jgi:hypothetical protein
LSESTDTLSHVEFRRGTSNRYRFDVPVGENFFAPPDSLFFYERAEDTKILRAEPSPTAHMGETDP